MSGKKWTALAFLGVMAASLVVLLVVGPSATAFPGLDGRRLGGDAVAVVYLSGTIQDSGGSLLDAGGVISPRLVRSRLRQAERDGSVRAVILRLDTGGGAVAASQEIAEMVRNYPKPVVVSMGDAAASGGYYIASQAQHIVAQPGTTTGSIGVIWASFDYSGLLDKLGIEVDAVTAGEHKDMFLPGRMTPERRQIMQGQVDQLYDQFVRAVAQGRGLEEEVVRGLATGQVYTGEEALRLGLVDTLGGLETALEVVKEMEGLEEARLVDLTPSFSDLFFGPGLGEMKGLIASYLLGDDLAMLREFMNGSSKPRYGG